jgi:hypothetical protein
MPRQDAALLSRIMPVREAGRCPKTSGWPTDGHAWQNGEVRLGRCMLGVRAHWKEEHDCPTPIRLGGVTNNDECFARPSLYPQPVRRSTSQWKNCIRCRWLPASYSQATLRLLVQRPQPMRRRPVNVSGLTPHGYCRLSDRGYLQKRKRTLRQQPSPITFNQELSTIPEKVKSYSRHRRAPGPCSCRPAGDGRGANSC